MPTLRYLGKPFLGFLSHKWHIGLYPYSGEVVERLKTELSDFQLAKGTIRVPLERPIAEETLKKIIDCRLGLIREQLRRQ